MILYNIRYRGPYEYDKFILNILQLNNEVNLAINEINNDTMNGLNLNIQKLNKIIEYYTDEEINPLQQLLIENLSRR
jgi:hypothetical protein